MYGLKKEHFDYLIDNFKSISSLKKVILYGSRAKGNYKAGSDIDLALIGDNLTLKNSIYPLMEKLDELPYFVDIAIYDKIKNNELKEHINKIGIVIYEINTGAKNAKLN